MNWYKTIKLSQFNLSNIAYAIYQRLIQAENGQADGESAVDDLYGQGLSPQDLEPAIQQAILKINTSKGLGDVGESTMLPAQQTVLAAIRGMSQPQQMEQEQGLEQEPIDAPHDQPIEDTWLA